MKEHHITLTKADVIEVVHKEIGFLKSQSEELIENFLESGALENVHDQRLTG